MSSSPVNVYYLVDKTRFETYVERKNTMDIEKEKYPKRISSKIEKNFKLLAGCNVRWNTLGCTTDSNILPKDLNVLHHSAYVITGNGSEPENFSCFLKLLISS